MAQEVAIPSLKSESYFAQRGRTPKYLAYALVLLALDGQFKRSDLTAIGAGPRDSSATAHRLVFDGIVERASGGFCLLPDSDCLDIRGIKKLRATARSTATRKRDLESAIHGGGIWDREAQGIVRAMISCGRLVEQDPDYYLWEDPLPVPETIAGPTAPATDAIFDLIHHRPGSVTDLLHRTQGRTYASVYKSVQTLLRYRRISIAPVPGKVYGETGREVTMRKVDGVYGPAYRDEAT